jgi:uncharacterized protein with GYD domain
VPGRIFDTFADAGHAELAKYPAVRTERLPHVRLDLCVYPGRRWCGLCRHPRGGGSIPTYVSLLNWTDQGIKNYKISPSRAAEVTKQVESSGGRVRELLWTVGKYDLVAVMEFPDDETATAVFLQVGSVGNVRSNTMRAFNADEMTAIIGKTG